MAEPRESIVEAFDSAKKLLRPDLLRRGLENLCLTSEAFLNIRTRFIKSYATFCVSSYILGIGDRHLENFLLDINDGEILGIDFGIAFDNGIQLGVPELIPFRLTQ
jgi:DNA-dependent protein kinase catalytic subunit